MATQTRKIQEIDGEELREDRIRRRAYELFLNRGGQHGLEHQDWLQAESEEEPPVEKEPTLKK